MASLPTDGRENVHGLDIAHVKEHTLDGLILTTSDEMIVNWFFYKEDWWKKMKIIDEPKES